MNIYLTFEREKKLREIADTKAKNISSLIGEWIDNFDAPKSNELPEDEKPNLKPMCERPFCKQRSEGQYRIVTDGIDEWTGNLCTFHWNAARKEGEVHEV